MKIVIHKPLVKIAIKYLALILEDIAKKTDNPYDDMVVQFLKEALPIITQMVDEIYEQV